jgi:hypothetical protein
MAYLNDTLQVHTFLFTIVLAGSYMVKARIQGLQRLLGVTKDNKDIRSPWMGAGRVSNMNDDIELPYQDPKFAEKVWWYKRLLLCV